MRITRSVYILSDRKRQKRRYVQERISSCISGGEHVQLKEAGCIIEGITPEDEEFQMLLEQGQCSLCSPMLILLCLLSSPKAIVIVICKNEDYTTALIKLGTFYKVGKYRVPRSYWKSGKFVHTSV